MTLYLQEKYQIPLHLPDKEEMSREQFLAFCEANSHFHIERNENQQILIMAPVGGETGTRHSDIVFAVQLWNTQTKLGKTFDSSTGFELPDGSMRSPDAAWIKKESWLKLSAEEKKGFVPFAPDFVVEVLSPSDKIEILKEKMKKWIQNGTRLGWLIDPKHEAAFIYRINGSFNEIQGFDKIISGEEVLPGFEFDLSALKD
jgi:Uma2 family endonuclease